MKVLQFFLPFCDLGGKWDIRSKKGMGLGLTKKISGFVRIHGLPYP